MILEKMTDFIELTKALNVEFLIKEAVSKEREACLRILRDVSADVSIPNGEVAFMIAQRIRARGVE